MLNPNKTSTLLTYALRLHRGDDLRQRLHTIVQHEEVAAAVILTCVGSLQSADLRLADETLPGPIPGPFEIVSLVGTLGEGGCHLHVALADAKGEVLGGHVRPGCIVHTTAEVVLGVLPELCFSRTFDPVTGFKELNIRGRCAEKPAAGQATLANLGIRAHHFAPE
ncbi:MAG: DNA-binding protein [Deltaproteobacteria bacterium]|nr:MAG: DNA-binding protein [Deltaproteobacteria bacterium]